VSVPRIREAGDAMLVAELGEAIDAATNRRAIGMASRVRAARLPGIRDVVPTFRSVAVTFDPLRTDLDRLCAVLQPTPEDDAGDETRAPVEIPVEYGGDAGPDLAGVAEASGLSVGEVIERHASRDYRVFMVGFLPGFAYLGTVDAGIIARRHASPRVRVPPGSVGIAGRQTGVYPQGSPGGWQIVGRTTLRTFDAARTPPSLLAPGDRVRFVPAPPGALGSFDAAWPPVAATVATAEGASRVLRVLQPGLLTTVQDAGRWGRQHEGVPVSGAMDVASLADANRAVGNPHGAAGLETTLGGLELRLEHEGALALAGGDFETTLDGRPVPRATRVEHQRGSVVRLGTRRAGARAYVAFDGGLDVPVCLGSRSTDLMTGIGGWHGRRLRAGDTVPVGRPVAAARGRATAPAREVPVGGARVRVLPGPHEEWFPPAAIDVLRRTRYEVTSESNRMGYRLRGSQPLPRDPREMISDATCAGGLQVPPSGHPILLTADRQVTGGYPIIATVISADLPVVGQLAPGDWIEFEPCTRGEALAALARLESDGDRVG
jgi:KipI family sensor histidine kinase inhibitor